MSKQMKHVQFVSTLSKGRNITKNSFDIVAKTNNKVERCFDVVAGVDGALQSLLYMYCLKNYPVINRLLSCINSTQNLVIFLVLQAYIHFPAFPPNPTVLPHFPLPHSPSPLFLQTGRCSARDD